MQHMQDMQRTQRHRPSQAMTSKREKTAAGRRSLASASELWMSPAKREDAWRHRGKVMELIGVEIEEDTERNWLTVEREGSEEENRRLRGWRERKKVEKDEPTEFWSGCWLFPARFSVLAASDPVASSD
ncbi:hypothetical protein CCMA1212_009077 [Trichoderma ghanense]|uniref:Uncharacterized protein n=1 Tax=Trichoderma ghanense TaxID=65468 RepID=A0ABY2GT52_9HYPO